MNNEEEGEGRRRGAGSERLGGKEIGRQGTQTRHSSHPGKAGILAHFYKGRTTK